MNPPIANVNLLYALDLSLKLFYVQRLNNLDMFDIPILQDVYILHVLCVLSL